MSEIENQIFEISGKNSKDKSYREKAKKIISRIKGSRNAFIRSIIRQNLIPIVEFCKIPDKQLDDDSFFDKYKSNKSSAEVKPKGIRPPAIKNIPIQSIDLSSNTDNIEEYYTKNESNDKLTENKGEENSQHIDSNNISNDIQNSNINSNSRVGLLALENNLEFNEENQSNKINITEIETNSVKTDSFSVREEIQPVAAEVERLSPKEQTKKTIQFNPPNKSNKNPPATNQTFDTALNRSHNNNCNINTTYDEGSSSKNPSQNLKQSDKLKELKELMEKQKQGKVIVFLNRT